MKDIITLDQEMENFEPGSIGFENHFEYEEHADAASSAIAATGKIQSFAAKNIPGGEVLSQLPSWQSVVGGARKKEDTSLTGFNKFRSTFTPLPFYPTKAEMIQAAQLGRWESAEAPAIQATYDENDGTWHRGDWAFQVISTSPITVKDFKGASETHTFSAPMNAKGSGLPSTGSQAMQSPSSGSPVNPATTTFAQFGNTQTPGSQPNVSPSQSAAMSPSVPSGNIPLSGAANIGGLNLGNMSPTTMAIGALIVLAVIAALIYFTNK